MSRHKSRVRQHVNPLGFRREVEVPDWRAVFAAAPDAPLEVDVGCAHGTFLLARAAQAPGRNVVGLEIRAPLVDEVRERIERLGLRNAAVVLCNANASFAELFAPGSVARVYVHFPDPWFKNRHRKRRLMTPAFVDVLASRLAPGGELEFMTDYEAYASHVAQLLAAHTAFEEAVAAAPPATERARSLREAWHEGCGDAIHRHTWRRRAVRC